ncbi:MAG: bifunctional phosphopantothenoylcysteine decarboxylase/phosphopantothenate--cysteine ligase CoaBC [Ornithinimicrobium sp.]
MHVVLGVSGGIAAYKACSLLRRFVTEGHQVTVVPTAAALRFVGAPTWAALSGRPVSAEVWDEVHQVPHVAVGQHADLVVVAPATADLLAKAAHGLADDLLTNVLLTAHAPMVLAPAMHTEMWLHPATAANVALLRSRGVDVLDPGQGRLTGADSGVGRLAEPEDIYHLAMAAAARSSGERGIPSATKGNTRDDMQGMRVVVSAGGTREALDPVRYLGNRSSGKQGYALAADAHARGADVVLVAANTTLSTPAGVDLRRVESAEQMQAALHSAIDEAPCAAVVMAAAVADYRPAQVARHKLKKAHGEEPSRGSNSPAAMVLELTQTPDILAGLVRRRGTATAPMLIGFAAETGDADGDVLDHARAKLARKGCDLLVANDVSAGATFGSDLSTIHLLAPDRDEVPSVGPVSKAQTASAVWDAVVHALKAR